MTPCTEYHSTLRCEACEAWLVTHILQESMQESIEKPSSLSRTLVRYRRMAYKRHSSGLPAVAAATITLMPIIFAITHSIICSQALTGHEPYCSRYRRPAALYWSALPSESCWSLPVLQAAQQRYGLHLHNPR